MEPIIDEASLVPCAVQLPATRILELARTLLALDSVGMPRVLRSVRDAPDRDLGAGHGLRRWCFDPSMSADAAFRDAGRLVATRLGKQPFIDGVGGLFASAEGACAVVATVEATPALGAGLAALTNGVVVTLVSNARPRGERLSVRLRFLDQEGGEREEKVELRTFGLAAEVGESREQLILRVDLTLVTGETIVRRLDEVFPHLVLGGRAQEQIARLMGTEPVFRQLVRHLRALEAGAARWTEGATYAPVAVSYSVESRATLDDGTLGPMRDFPTPAGFDAERWSLHTKLTGGNGARLYFRAVRREGRGLVLVGYFGDHLPTVRYRT